MWPWQRWGEDRDRRRRAAAFVATLQREPETEAVQWLARHGSHGDVDHARWELRYARRALGLVAASRDALDDRTASIVAAALSESLRRDPVVPAPSLERVERQLAARVRGYTESLASRRAGVSPVSQLGTTLLAFAGPGTEAAPEAVSGAGKLMRGYLTEANDALREIFGAASLPENVTPSVWATGEIPPAKAP